MTVSLSEFHSLVSDGLGRGTSVDTLIPERVRMAAAWIEKNYTFQYMKTWRTLSVSTTAQYPYIISLADIAVKRVTLLRRREADLEGTGFIFSDPLKKLAPDDRSTRGEGIVESYWINGRNSIVLNAIPTEDLTLEAHLVEYTKWGSGDNWTHWLLDNCTQLLLCRTMMILGSTRLRDPKLWEVYKAEFDLEIQAMNVSEEDIQEEDVVAQWEPPFPDLYSNMRTQT